MKTRRFPMLKQSQTLINDKTPDKLLNKTILLSETKRGTLWKEYVSILSIQMSVLKNFQ